MNNYKDWIGKKISRSDIITPRLVDHFKKTIDQNCLSDQTVPEGIFLCLCPDVSSIIDLDKDGNTKLGIFLPELPYKIRMWAGGKIKIFDEFEIGSEIKKNSKISSIEFKEGRSGNLCFVNINHEYLNKNKLIVSEDQTAVYREKINKKSNSLQLPGLLLKATIRQECSTRPDVSGTGQNMNWCRNFNLLPFRFLLLGGTLGPTNPRLMNIVEEP